MKYQEINPAGGQAERGGESQYRCTHVDNANTATISNAHHNWPIVPLATISPEAYPSGKAQMILYIAPRGVNPPFIAVCPLASAVSCRGFSRWYHGVGVLVRGKANQSRVHTQVWQKMSVVPQLQTTSDVVHFLSKARALVKEATL